jgi:hypothetical protein
MSRGRPGRLFLVLASRRAFESLTGRIPEAMRPLFRFRKPNQAARIQALLPQCRLVITKNYRRPACNRWVLEARRQGIPTLLLVDGPLEWSNLYHPRQGSGQGSGHGEKATLALFEPILHDAVAAIGDAQKRWIAHKNQGREITFMSYANQRIQTAFDPTRTTSGAEFDFLVTTAKTAYFGTREKIALCAVIEACATALDRTGHSVLVRVEDGALRQAIQRRIPRCAFDTSESFTEALVRTRCVIGTPSSVLLEAMRHGKPTGQLMFRDSPLFYQAGWLLGCNEDWKTSFASMLARDRDRMDFQLRTLRDNLSEEDFFSHCQKIASAKQLESPRPFDALDLEFENKLFRDLLGWRARLFAPILHSLSTRWRGNSNTAGGRTG